MGPDLQAVRVAEDVRRSGALKDKAISVVIVLCFAISGRGLGGLVGFWLGSWVNRGCVSFDCIAGPFLLLAGVVVGWFLGGILGLAWARHSRRVEEKNRRDVQV
jgi:membrane protein YqaA with SNARE-associated domain